MFLMLNYCTTPCFRFFFLSGNLGLSGVGVFIFKKVGPQHCASATVAHDYG